MIAVAIDEITVASLPMYDAIPSRFLVKSILRVDQVDGGLGEFNLRVEDLPVPYMKDYDRGSADLPSSWPHRFPKTPWGFFLARRGDRVVGGAAVALDPALLPAGRFQREDLAVLWDIRVHPEERGSGIATQLFIHAAAWARSHGRAQLGIETQNVNLPACRFYAKQGCRLGAIHRFGYAGCPDVAHEAMILWYLDL